MNSLLALTEPAFNVIGITARTNNQENLQMNGPIARLWQQFFEQQLLAKIPHKVDHAIIALYYDYESDKSGNYTLLIGARVSSLKDIPASMIAKHVPAEKRVIYQTQGGVMGIVKAWQSIWDSEEKGTLKRSYTVDYELHQDFKSIPAEAHAEVHIGV